MNSYSIYSDLDEDFKALKAQASTKLPEETLPSNEDVLIEDLFVEEKKQETSSVNDKPMLVYDYFDLNAKKQKSFMPKHGGPQTIDPMSKGFDIRAFRLKQAAQRVQTESKAQAGAIGLGRYREEDDFGVAVPTMKFDKGEAMNIDAEKVLENFNDEDMIKKDEEEAAKARTSFAFGGQSVRDRIKKRKMNSRIGSEVHKLEKMIRAK